MMEFKSVNYATRIKCKPCSKMYSKFLFLATNYGFSFYPHTHKEGSMNSGYLYVLVHPSDPGLYKIGVTTHHPEKRLAEHNSNYKE